MVIWARLAQEGTHLMFPYLELAKHYEHRAKDYITGNRVHADGADAGVERGGAGQSWSTG